MNNELLTLFDIKDDIVESFTIDNIGTYYEINIRFKHLLYAVLIAVVSILLVKVLKRKG